LVLATLPFAARRPDQAIGIEVALDGRLALCAQPSSPEWAQRVAFKFDRHVVDQSDSDAAGGRTFAADGRRPSLQARHVQRSPPRVGAGEQASSGLAERDARHGRAANEEKVPPGQNVAHR
jgi:hypothetical protein